MKALRVHAGSRALRDYRTQITALTAANLAPSVLASCSIPYWLDPVHDIRGGPRGAYWDGGITDYLKHRNESERLRNEFAAFAGGGSGLAAQPLT